MKRIAIRSLALALIALTGISTAYAQGGDFDPTKNPLSKALLIFIQFINSVLVPLLFAVAFFVFIWGVFQMFILGGTNEEKRDEGKKLVTWGIIGFFVMVSVWGIVNLFANTFGFGGESAPPVPTFNGSQAAPQEDDPLEGLF